VMLDRDGGFPVAEDLAETIVSLPLSPEHSYDEIVQVAQIARRAAFDTTTA
jgi:dTDP-4-amino-4,6-dideoxygalactose transaminase